MAGSAIHIAPPSADVINLAIASIVIHSILLPVAAWITWSHGKTGMLCWPIFLSFFALQFLSDGWQISVRDKPNVPNAVSIFTNAGIMTCLAFGIVGIVFEATPWVNRGFLGLTHLANTVGITLATYGGSPSEKKHGQVASSILNKTGNCLIIFVLAVLGIWVALIAKSVLRYPNHPHVRHAKIMLITASLGWPFQTIRTIYSATYAFDRIPDLDPVMGSFTTKLVLIFGLQLIVTLVLIAGGWLTKDVNKNKALRVRSHELELEALNN
ncbi:hypothetical protein GMORB2_4715 [Geosmithia morbida]|uniref:DUF7702 domain-containing protein n=1 Tax=Geosmithia morbida TaxID=1094350 RepID=A0A9P5D180_9HYPO|nr:uncharacterized protein GMORB2_4715 [Geosmithia morbida]KAF4119585.1 hypothetical protein GMORB2_4715 [Geosmithia morbida]